MADKLSLFNGALLICGERFLSSLTENREPRHLLDNVWSNGGVKACLEQGVFKPVDQAAQLAAWIAVHQIGAAWAKFLDAHPIEDDLRITAAVLPKEG